MAMQDLTGLTLEEAQKILGQFNCTNPNPEWLAGKVVIQAAVLLVARCSDYLILGICADTVAQGSMALKTYAAALGYEATVDTVSIEGPVYIKFNPQTGLCYVDSRFSKYRGVLVSYQSSDPGGINQMYGHLPLDLFAPAA